MTKCARNKYIGGNISLPFDGSQSVFSVAENILINTFMMTYYLAYYIILCNAIIIMIQYNEDKNKH